MNSPSTTGSVFRTPPELVHEVLSRHILADGFPIVFDFEKSRGALLHDSRSGQDYLDLFSFFASQPLGYNHPRMNDADFVARLGLVARAKPTNSDVYTQAFADFVDSFAGIVPESHRKRLFFIEGGALAVENALKAAFDWKFRRNRESGGPDTEDLQILHFENAFHGRTGYTLSLTNTHDPKKYQYFPRFDWPRVPHPAMSFPCEGEALAATEAAERCALEAAKSAFCERKHLIAAVIIETIQGEGGDAHVRPEFLKALADLCREEEALLIFDEVQSGMGLTGTWWAFEQLGVIPDLFCFGKKSQVCGIAGGPRLDEVDSVFDVSSRINSTWGGNLVDMVRVDHVIRIIREESLLDNVRRVGDLVLTELRDLAARTGSIDNVRGRGLMIAFDLPDEASRDAMQKRLFDAHVIMLPCGERSLRFRPVLDFSETDARVAVERIAAHI